MSDWLREMEKVPLFTHSHYSSSRKVFIYNSRWFQSHWLNVSCWNCNDYNPNAILFIALHNRLHFLYTKSLWFIFLLFSQDHLNVCPYFEVPCPLGKCKEKMMRKDISEHLSWKCKHRETTCEFCMHKMAMTELQVTRTTTWVGPVLTEPVPLRE